MESPKSSPNTVSQDGEGALHTAATKPSPRPAPEGSCELGNGRYRKRVIKTSIC